jgi:hypothetical protein
MELIARSAIGAAPGEPTQCSQSRRFPDGGNDHKLQSGGVDVVDFSAIPALLKTENAGDTFVPGVLNSSGLD